MASRKQDRINRLWGEMYHSGVSKPEELSKPKRVYGPALDPAAPWFVNYEKLANWFPPSSHPVVFDGTPEAAERDRVQAEQRRLTRPWEYDEPETVFTAGELERIAAASRVMAKEGGLVKVLLYEFAQILRERTAAAQKKGKGK